MGRPASTWSPASRQATYLLTQGRRIEAIEHDFGTVWAGDAVQHTFEVVNTSDRVLGLRNVSAGCGCTTTSKWEKQVQPHETWKLEVSLNTAARPGKFSETATVTTDDPR